MVVDDAGPRSVKPFAPRPPRFCIFEHIYFARPDSVVEGTPVYATRKRIGAELAREAPVRADVVVPVPDSGVPAAMGYAAEAGIPFELGIIRNHYVGRTFIEPTDQIRHLGVKLKHSANRAMLAGKRVILVDDSIVRGTTSRKIVEMVRNAGATEVHMRISSPPTTHSCYYGIDTPEPRRPDGGQPQRRGDGPHHRRGQLGLHLAGWAVPRCWPPKAVTPPPRLLRRLLHRRLRHSAHRLGTARRAARTAPENARMTPAGGAHRPHHWRLARHRRGGGGGTGPPWRALRAAGPHAGRAGGDGRCHPRRRRGRHPVPLRPCEGGRKARSARPVDRRAVRPAGYPRACGGGSRHPHAGGAYPAGRIGRPAWR